MEKGNLTVGLLILILGLAGCISPAQYKKDTEKLRYEIAQKDNQIVRLEAENAVLVSENQRLQRVKEEKAPSTVTSRGSATRLVNFLKEKGLEVIIRDGAPAVVVNNIFDPGEVSLSKDGKKSMKKVADILVSIQSDYSLRVDGYTDNQPITKSKDYKDNQELSAARAKNVAEFLAKEGGLPKSDIQSQGLGEVNPIASNKTKVGRDKNRRVELVILLK